MHFWFNFKIGSKVHSTQLKITCVFATFSCSKTQQAALWSVTLIFTNNIFYSESNEVLQWVGKKKPFTILKSFLFIVIPLKNKSELM
jgi:hypothetical protein